MRRRQLKPSDVSASVLRRATPQRSKAVTCNCDECLVLDAVAYSERIRSYRRPKTRSDFDAFMMRFNW